MSLGDLWGGSRTKFKFKPFFKFFFFFDFATLKLILIKPGFSFAFRGCGRWCGGREGEGGEWEAKKGGTDGFSTRSLVRLNVGELFEARLLNFMSWALREFDCMINRDRDKNLKVQKLH